MSFVAQPRALRPPGGQDRALCDAQWHSALPNAPQWQRVACEINKQMDIAVATEKGPGFREAIYRMRRNLRAAPVPFSLSNNLQGLTISW